MKALPRSSSKAVYANDINETSTSLFYLLHYLYDELEGIASICDYATTLINTLQIRRR